MRTHAPGFVQPRIARHLPLAAAIALAFAPAAQASPTEVTNTGDDPTPGSGSLRSVMLFVQSQCTSVTNPVITFNLGTGGPFTIQPSSPLPVMTCSANFNPTINGYSQASATPNTLAAGFNANLRVIIDGSSMTYGGGCGLEFNNPFYGGKLTVKGLKVQDFGAGRHGVCGAVDLFGNIITNNSGYGANLYAPNAVAGGPAAADRNVFTGNDIGGISATSSGVVIENNFVGTANGSSAAGNGVGVYVGGSSALITGNTISGNDGYGIYIYGDYGGSTIEDNKIGTNAAESGALANKFGGVLIEESQNITINNNVISGNTGPGVSYEDSSQLDITSNYIGVNSAGTAIKNTLGLEGFCGGYTSINSNVISSNQFEGVVLSGTFATTLGGNTIGRNGTTGLRIAAGGCYGGNNFVGPNSINNNGDDGIQLVGGTTGNQISQALSFANGRKNINLNGSSSALPNDAGDTDGGSNNQQNYPVISQVLQDDGDTEVTFTLDSLDGNYVIEFFANDVAGAPAGKTFLGSRSVSVFGGPFTESAVFTGLYDNISVTATNQSTLDTSEYSPQKAAITAPAASVTPSTLNFGDVLVGSESADKNSTIRSIGDLPLVLESVDDFGSCYGGDFLQSKKAKASAAAFPSLCYGGAFICSTTCETERDYNTNETCRVTARFAPQSFGFYSQNIYICDNTSNSPKSILLQGNAVLPPPLTITPKSWDFGGVPVGEFGEPKKFTFTNISYGSVQILDVATTGEFDLLSNGCPKFLYGGQSCDAVVNFGPTESGELNGSVYATYTTMLGLQAVAVGSAEALPLTTSKTGAALTGVGLAGGTLVLPEAIELGAMSVGSSSSRTVELRNTGNSPVTVSSVTVSAPFTLVNNCTAPIAPQATCTLVIGFTAPSVGSFSGTLTVVSDASGGSGEIPVHATGQTIAAPLLQIVPTAMGFGDRVIGSSTLTQTVNITNIGGAPALNLALTIPSVDFLVSGNTCGTTLIPAASCQAQVAFRPLGFGLRISSLVVTSNGVGSPQAVTLSGTGCRPFIASGNRVGDNTNCAP